jgi:hypothetical protein
VTTVRSLATAWSRTVHAGEVALPSWKSSQKSAVTPAQNAPVTACWVVSISPVGEADSCLLRPWPQPVLHAIIIKTSHFADEKRKRTPRALPVFFFVTVLSYRTPL